MNWLEGIADLATITTAGVAVYGYGSYRCAITRRKLKIEDALKQKCKTNDDSLTVQQLAAKFVLTVEQVIEAASRSDKIEGVEGLKPGERRLRYIRNPN